MVLLMISALALDGIALFFQHGMGLQPCVMCIYERIAVLGIAFAGFLGWIAPRSAIIRWLAIVLWIYSGIAGLQLSWEHTMIQLYPSPFNTCDFFVNFRNGCRSIPGCRQCLKHPVTVPFSSGYS